MGEKYVLLALKQQYVDTTSSLKFLQSLRRIANSMIASKMGGSQMILILKLSALYSRNRSDFSPRSWSDLPFTILLKVRISVQSSSCTNKNENICYLLLFSFTMAGIIHRLLL